MEKADSGELYPWDFLDSEAREIKEDVIFE